MASFVFKHVCLESFALNLPPCEVTSAELEDRLAPLYERLSIPFGTLEKLSGIKSRFFWKERVKPSEAAAQAAKEALAKAEFDHSHIKVLINCSVTRDYFEPATAMLVHNKLGFPEDTMAFDVTNACIGFSNGIVMVANLIESGVVKAGVVVTGENMGPITDASFKLIDNNEDIDREELLRILPSFTLGSGATAFVLCHDSIASQPMHRIVGSMCRSASQCSELCVGNGDYCFEQQSGLNPLMTTDSSAIMGEAAKLGGRTWKDASEVLGWSRDDVDHIFCHQVGKQVNAGFYREMGLDMEKEFTVYKKMGNLVSAALPAAFITGVSEKEMKPGDKILFTAFGSGLNAIFTGLEW